MAIKYELLAKGGVYKDATGADKTRWVKCGVVMDTKQGGLAAKLEKFPVNWDGWLNFAEPRAKDSFKARGDDEMPKAKQSSNDLVDDAIPF